ncbi:allophanate hydrolase subunit 1 (plasmid) [Rhizobium sp. 32-5/1]|uniref:5-oxoprolinase subunit B family protein n=1 Tax=Rhizobium sp. 32-5/1 TaxID=3019602 RepID=UPI00240D215B|nr:allophanate hydrolase subunit 1 [Rhizobium sp. 32-5/1]WEZ86077.1 allophanate hydrolase subunit 1 [Rhizobium sp. 32-5/1]
MLVEFGEIIDERIHRQVLRLDAALKVTQFDGFVEAVPAYASVLVCFDPLVTDHQRVETALSNLIANNVPNVGSVSLREVEVCYDADLGSDLASVAEATGISAEEVVNAHLAGDYSVFMYGFAPGYAYLAGVPQPIQLPRKQAAVRGVAAGSVLIAGPQCLVSTLNMPTGWWIIGRSPTKILDPSSENHPFLFDVGDRVRFRRISRAEFEASSRS